jgi:glycosyltransferase involved in cell wall biosynthesis
VTTIAPLFNVILPTIGRESLDRAVQSVLDQGYNDWHLWIICDGFMIRGMDTDNITVIGLDDRHNDNGAFARNFGVNYESIWEEDWIAYLDDDDLWLPHHLSTIASIIEENPNITMGRTSGQQFRMRHLHPRTSCRKMRLGSVNTTDIMTPGLFHTKELFNKTRGWTTDLNRHDAILWQDMISAGGTYVESQEVTFLYEK